MASEELCEPRKDRLLDMPVDLAKNFKGVSYGDIALTECDVEGRVVFHPLVWYRLFERKAGQLCAVIERATRKPEVSNNVFGEGYEITGAV
jgi:hypothetical protein